MTNIYHINIFSHHSYWSLQLFQLFLATFLINAVITRPVSLLDNYISEGLQLCHMMNSASWNVESRIYCLRIKLCFTLLYNFSPALSASQSSSSWCCFLFYVSDKPQRPSQNSWIYALHTNSHYWLGDYYPNWSEWIYFRDFNVKVPEDK